MKEERTKKAKLWRYSSIWSLLLISGVICWFLAYAFSIDIAREEPTLLPTATFAIGLVCGFTGLVCYFGLIEVLSPIAKWLWGKLGHNPRSFLELLT